MPLFIPLQYIPVKTGHATAFLPPFFFRFFSSGLFSFDPPCFFLLCLISFCYKLLFVGKFVAFGFAFPCEKSVSGTELVAFANLGATQQRCHVFWCLGGVLSGRGRGWLSMDGIIDGVVVVD